MKERCKLDTKILKFATENFLKFYRNVQTYENKMQIRHKIFLKVWLQTFFKFLKKALWLMKIRCKLDTNFFLRFPLEILNFLKKRSSFLNEDVNKTQKKEYWFHKIELFCCLIRLAFSQPRLNTIKLFSP